MSFKPTHHYMFQLASQTYHPMGTVPAILVYENKGQPWYMNGKDGDEHIDCHEFPRKYSKHINKLCNECNKMCEEGKTYKEIKSFIVETGEDYLSGFLL